MKQLLPLAWILTLASCSDQVTLRSQTGSLALDYTCAGAQTQLGTPEASTLLKEYAILSVRDANFQHRDTAALVASQAYAVDDLPALEQAVVRYVCTYGDVRAAAAPRFPERGSSPPEFSLYQAGPSTHVITRSSTQGHVVVLAFWATWCSPCREEFRELRQLYEKYNGKGAQVYIVLREDDPEPARAWMRDHGGEIPFLVDPDSKVANRFHVRGIPSTFILDQSGRVAGHFLSSGNHLEEHMRPLLASPAWYPESGGE